jgi:hypothetical protein
MLGAGLRNTDVATVCLDTWAGQRACSSGKVIKKMVLYDLTDVAQLFYNEGCVFRSEKQTIKRGKPECRKRISWCGGHANII